MFNVIGAIVSGLFVGVLARFFYPGAVDMGLGKTVLLGIGGALLAGLITASRSASGVGQGFNRAGFFASVLGAMALIFIARTLG